MTNPNLKTLEAFFESVSGGDSESMVNLYTEDFVLELPFANFEGVRAEGLAEVGEYLKNVLGKFKVELKLSHVYETTDPDILIAEYTSTGEFLPEGIPYDNRYISVYKFRNGQICEVKEFFNPLRADLKLRQKQSQK